MSSVSTYQDILCICRYYQRAWIAQSIEWLGYGLDNWDIEVRLLLWSGGRPFRSEMCSYQSRELSRFHTLLEPLAHFAGETHPEREATSHFLVVPRLRLRGVIPPFPHITVLSLHFCHHHHHLVHEGLGVLSCSLILKVKLVTPSLPRSSYVPLSLWSILQCLFWYSVCVHPRYVL
jgi:hypothetical protein